MNFLKPFVKWIDSVFFRGRIKQIHKQMHLNYRSKLHDKVFLTISNSQDWQFTTHYKKNPGQELSLLCDLYGSDKGESKEFGHPYPWPSHSYADYYTRIFSQCRGSVKRVFECGIGTNNPTIESSMGITGKPGASLRVWRDYFPNALIFGADIDRNILFEEERIKTFYIDQLNPESILDFWSLAGGDEFDIIIDDGLHTFEAGSTLFQCTINYLTAGGVYVIEDVSLENLLRYNEFFQDTNYLVDYVILERQNRYVDGNCLIVIRK